MIRDTQLTIDFLNKCIFTSDRTNKALLSDDILEKFLTNAVDPFWNTDKDKIDFFCYYNTGEYFCQRKKLKHDFSTGSSYWYTYNFTGASPEQAKEFFELCAEFFNVVREVKTLKIDAVIKEVDKEYLFYEQRYLKKMSEKTAMLQTSDWRILPDVPESFPGEKDMWIQWRAYIRDESIRKPSDFESNLEFFKYTYDIKYPVDPNGYRKLYPDGLLEDGITPAPEYMDKEDPQQWVRHDGEASSDFLKTRISTMYQLGGQYKKSYKKIRSSMLELMKLLEVDSLVDFDWNRYYTENDTDVTFE